MAARRKLGKALAVTERGEPGRSKEIGTPRTSFFRWATSVLNLAKPRIIEAQRIGTMPDETAAEGVEPADRQGARR